MRNKLAIFGFLLGIAIVIFLAHVAITYSPPFPDSQNPPSTMSPMPLPSEPSPSDSPPPEFSPTPSMSLPMPAPSASPIPPTSMGIVDEIVTNLEWGNIAFDTPKKMQFEEPKTIELLLSSTKSVQELQSSLKSHEQIESARIQISNRMEAHLSGQGFKIEALVPQEQAVYRGKTTQWKWEVTPTKNGNQNLYLTLSAIINVSNQKVPLVIRTFDKTIKVDVSVGQQISTFVSGNLEWLWASILVPISPFIWRWYKKKRNKNQPPNNPGAAD